MSDVLGFKSVLTTKARKAVNCQCSHLNLVKQIINSGYTVERKKKSNLKQQQQQQKTRQQNRPQWCIHVTGYLITFELQDGVIC